MGLVSLATMLVLSACSQGSRHDSETESTSGEAVYRMPLEDGNSFACATCHALSEPSSDGLRRPGHPIGDASRRSLWKNGKATTLLDAVNSCVTEWMVAPAWEDSDPRFLALRRFLDARAPSDHAPNLAYEIVAPPADLNGGDPDRGRALFDQSCVVCHGAGGLGTRRGPRVAGSVRLPEYIASRIRTSGSPSSPVYAGLTGGVMPFWARDRLSDDEVRDLVAFVTAPAAPGVEGGGAGGAEGGPEPPSSCGKTNPRVGRTADLGINTGEGQVSGFVTMVDDCTLELHDFSYDGNGIDVRVYGSASSDFRPAFTMGPNLVGRTFNKDVFRVALPDGKTLDDLEWVGIWCVAVGANFGSGRFEEPR